MLMSLIKTKFASQTPVQSLNYRQIQRAKVDLRNARGFRGNDGNGRQGRKDVAYLKSIAKCKACNQVGHWHKDQICPKRSGTQSSNYFMELENVDLDGWIATQSVPEEQDLAEAWHQASGSFAFDFE